MLNEYREHVGYPSQMLLNKEICCSTPLESLSLKCILYYKHSTPSGSLESYCVLFPRISYGAIVIEPFQWLAVNEG